MAFIDLSSHTDHHIFGSTPPPECKALVNVDNQNWKNDNDKFYIQPTIDNNQPGYSGYDYQTNNGYDFRSSYSQSCQGFSVEAALASGGTQVNFDHKNGFYNNYIPGRYVDNAAKSYLCNTHNLHQHSLQPQYYNPNGVAWFDQYYVPYNLYMQPFIYQEIYPDDSFDQPSEQWEDQTTVKFSQQHKVDQMKKLLKQDTNFTQKEIDEKLAVYENSSTSSDKSITEDKIVSGNFKQRLFGDKNVENRASPKLLANIYANVKNKTRPVTTKRKKRDILALINN